MMPDDPRTALRLNVWNETPAHECGIPLIPDPEDECVCCAGSGMRRWFDADCGWEYEACPACMGTASAGVFIVRLHVGRLRYERSWSTKTFDIALASAERWAELLRLFCGRIAVAGADVVVAFSAIDQTQPTEDVHAVAVWRREPTRAA